MSNVTNLNQFRKAKAKREARAEADNNAVKFGRSKAERDLAKARLDKSLREIDAHHADDDTDPPQ
ncbi:MAG: DUF4169 family protein [Paracoccaceae bacterium]